MVDLAVIKYDTLIEDKSVIRVLGGAFEASTNNCGSSGSSVETIVQVRSFTYDVKWDAKLDVEARVGEGLIRVDESALKAHLERKLGVHFGVSSRFESWREITTPGNSYSIVTLQWEEVWTKGTIHVQGSNDVEMNAIPFLALTSLRLNQLGSRQEPCPPKPRTWTPTTISRGEEDVPTYTPFPATITVSEVPIPPSPLPPTRIPSTRIPPTRIPSTRIPRHQSLRHRSLRHLHLSLPQRFRISKSFLVAGCMEKRGHQCHHQQENTSLSSRMEILTIVIHVILDVLVPVRSLRG